MAAVTVRSNGKTVPSVTDESKFRGCTMDGWLTIGQFAGRARLHLAGFLICESDSVARFST
jgi:hypothetical protein